jgi:hypothetical protein
VIASENAAGDAEGARLQAELAETAGEAFWREDNRLQSVDRLGELTDREAGGVGFGESMAQVGHKLKVES